jgi:antitoxin ParD1/3/4
MNISLTPELENLVLNKVKTGLYNSSSEVIREALRLLKEHDQLQDIKLRELKREVKIGVDQLERGEKVSGDEVFRELKERHRKRLKTNK